MKFKFSKRETVILGKPAKDMLRKVWNQNREVELEGDCFLSHVCNDLSKLPSSCE